MKTDLEEIKKISITEYARQMGFTPVKIGSYYTLKEHDSVRIDPGRTYSSETRQEIGEL